MAISPRKDIDRLVPATHGGLDFAELERLGLRADEITDFSVCSNPFGPPPSVRADLDKAAIDRYPDSDATELRRALAAHLGASPQNIMVSNGSTELIRLAALAYFGPGDTIIIPMPNFGEYEIASRLSGAGVVTPRLTQGESFHLPVADVAAIVRKHHAKGLFLSNPNNPTGQFLLPGELEVILAVAPDCLVIVDEAYISFVDNARPSLELIGRDNLLILRSMTKDYTLPGLRLGYAMANAEIIETLRKVRPPWNVNAPAQQAGLLALQDKQFLPKSLERLREERDFLSAAIEHLGLPVIPTRANFFLVRVGNAKAFRDKLLRMKMMVRDCTSFGLPEYIRLAPRMPEENRQLVSALKEMVKGEL